LIAGTLRFCKTKKITLIPDYNMFSETELCGFIFPTIVDNFFVNRYVNDSRENETKNFGFGKLVVMIFLVLRNRIVPAMNIGVALDYPSQD